MPELQAFRVDSSQAAWLEEHFNAQWPWPRPPGAVARLVDLHPHFAVCDADGRYLGHCHVRPGEHRHFLEQGIPEIADLNVMPDSRRRGAATALMDAAEAHISRTSALAGIGVGLYDDYGPAQRLYSLRGYVLDGTGTWAGTTQVRGGQTVIADDDLVIYLTRRLP